MSGWFSSGAIVDIALLLIAIEAVVLLFVARYGKIRVTAWPILANLASGACLLLAVRAALIGADWPYVALAMTGAFVAHAIDLIARIRPR